MYWFVLNRTTLGFEVKAVGFNPEAARYGGISVARNFVVALAISGAFAGLAGAMDILGWEFSIATNDIQVSQIGFIGIAVALLGRGRAVGILLAALLFGGLEVGTSTRALDPSVFPPELAEQPGHDHPGADRALRRRRAPARLRVASAARAADASPRLDTSLREEAL